MIYLLQSAFQFLEDIFCYPFHQQVQIEYMLCRWPPSHKYIWEHQKLMSNMAKFEVNINPHQHVTLVYEPSRDVEWKGLAFQNMVRQWSLNGNLKCGQNYKEWNAISKG